jgi:molecular chaperone GrpE
MTTEPQDNYDGGDAQFDSQADAQAESIDLSQLSLDEQVAVLTEGLKRAHLEAAQNLDTAQRAQAEMVNFRKRTDDERIANAKYSNGRLIAKLLPSVEELDLAIAHADQGGNNDSWIEGVKLIQRKLNGVLESEGVTSIKAEGVMFNPLEHEALGTEDSTEHPPGYITQTLRTGYRLHDRVIRAAQVMVARTPQDSQQQNSTGNGPGSEEGTNG